VQVTTVPAVSAVKVTGSQPLDNSVLTPDTGSLRVQLTVTSVLFQPAAFGAGLTTGVTTGGVRSIFTTTDAELVRPAPSTAEHVNVVPAVSADKVAVPQPELEVMPDSGSVTLQLTVTGAVVIHPPTPAAGLTVGTMTGGVVSPVALITVNCVGNPALAKSDVAKVRVLPAASDRNTNCTVHVPFSLPLGNVAVAVPLTDVLAVNVAVAFCVEPPDWLKNAT